MVATPRVGLLGFEPLLELRASLNSYLHNSSGIWSEGQLAGLRTQLEGARATIEYLANDVAAHSRILEQWKPNAAASSSSSSHHADHHSHDNKRRHESTEKKNKKRRVHEDFKLAENDSSYSSYSSPEEADVDVDGDEGDIDVEALDGDDSHAGDGEDATKEDEYVPRNRIKRGGSGGRNSMAQMIVRRHQGKPSVRRQKFKNMASGSSTSNQRRKSDMPPTASPTEYDAGVAGAAVSSSESEEETVPVPLGSGAFWTAMEPYLRAPTEQDLAYITPKPPRENDPIFTIPPLGSHYSQVWASDDGVASPPVRHSSRATGKEMGNDDSSIDNDAPDPVMGDITKRILQSLIDEHIIMNRPPSPFPDESPMLVLDENKENNTSSIPTIPVVNYSRAQMIALEGRIKLELHAIGLLDDEDTSEREDDEVCAELRLNQSLLKDQIAINNEQRMKLIALVKAKMHEHEENQKQKAFNVQIEKNYQKLVQRKKKRGGRRAPSHVGT